jgi:hypothetical protein
MSPSLPFTNVTAVVGDRAAGDVFGSRRAMPGRLLLMQAVEPHRTPASRSVQQDQARAELLLLEALEGDPNRSMAHFSLGISSADFRTD